MGLLRYNAKAISGQTMDKRSPSVGGGISHHTRLEKKEVVAYNVLASLTRVDHLLVIAL